MLDFMPEAASTWAHQVDWINNVITWISVFFTVAITGVMLYFAFIYRKKSPDADNETAYITHNASIETVWTVIPTIICIGIFYYGFAVYHEMRNPPANAIEINVDAYSWRWEFKYANGKKSTNEIVVPVNEPVKLIMTAHGVLHSFFIPAMRVKEDLRPGSYSYLWFEPKETGEFHVFCAEYCGTNHSAMRAKLKVVSREEYDDFLLTRVAGDAPKLSPEELGEQLYSQKACIGCHSLDGSAVVGPSFKGLFKNEQRQIEGGEMVKVDENYIKESILYPQKKIAAGYTNAVMPSYEGQLTEEEIQGIIAYLKTL